MVKFLTLNVGIVFWWGTCLRVATCFRRPRRLVNNRYFGVERTGQFRPRVRPLQCFRENTRNWLVELAPSSSYVAINLRVEQQLKFIP
jgi:hypothetical protein